MFDLLHCNSRGRFGATQTSFPVKMQSKSTEIQSTLDVRATGSQHEGAGKPQPEDNAERQLLLWKRVTIPLNNNFQRQLVHRNSVRLKKTLNTSHLAYNEVHFGFTSSVQKQEPSNTASVTYPTETEQNMLGTSCLSTETR